MLEMASRANETNVTPVREGDRRQVAKYVCRARCIVPLRGQRPRRDVWSRDAGSYCGQVASGSRLMMGCEPETGTMGRRYGRPTVL